MLKVKQESDKIKVIDKILNNIKKDKITKCWIYQRFCNRDGYGVVWDSIVNGIKIRYLTHRYVYWYYKLKPFGKKLTNKFEVCHKCDNPPCCNPKHLFKATHKQNVQDCINKGRQARGEIIPQSKLTEKKVLQIYKHKGSYRTIANKFNICFHTVLRIKNKKTWKWLFKENKL